MRFVDRDPQPVAIGLSLSRSVRLTERHERGDDPDVAQEPSYEAILIGEPVYRHPMRAACAVAMLCCATPSIHPLKPGLRNTRIGS
jgi:hypothetical protein